MIPISVETIAGVIGADRAGWRRGDLVERVSTDSRDVRSGDLFFALGGDRFDGHRFVGSALASGARACVCSKRSAERVPERFHDRCLWVDDSTAALGRLAGHYRRCVLPASVRVVAVTGSNGKTTTKDMIDHVLSGSMKGRCAPRSFNNAIGVPLTLLGADADARYVITEIGTNAPGEIGSLAAMARPDVAVITSLGEAHLEGLGDIEAIATEKTSILDCVGDGGVAFVNVDHPSIRSALRRRSPRVRIITFGTCARAALRVRQIRTTIRETRFEIEGFPPITLSLPGAHHATNATAAAAVGRWFAVDPAEIVDRLGTFHSVGGRTRVIECGGLTVVDDTYNANPASMSAAIETLRTAAHGRRVFVMGDMLELGEAGDLRHRAAVQSVLDAGIEVLLTVGDACRSAVDACVVNPRGAVVCCRDSASAAATLGDLVMAGDTVWLKGSRRMGLEALVASLERSERSVVEAPPACVAVA